MKQQHKTIFLWTLLIVLFVIIYNLFTSSARVERKISFNEFYQFVKEKKVVDLKIKGMELTGKIIYDKGKDEPFKTIGIIGEKMQKELLSNNIPFSYQKDEGHSFWTQVIVSWIPMIFLFFIFYFFMRQLQAGGGKALSFGKSKARLVSEYKNKITFKDVAGIDEVITEIEEIIEFLKDPKKFTRLGGRIPKGILLMGAPGTGKTLVARAIAGEAGVPFFSISGSDFVEMFVGVGASRVRDLFEQGKKNAPCIIFIDEIDAVGRHRGAGLGGGHDEREQTLNQLLVEMDGFESNEGVILIAATNRPDVLDPAILRPGRFDRRIVVPMPDLKGRLGIIKVHTKKTPLDEGVQLEDIAKSIPGFSGADIENLVNEAALLAARNNQDFLAMRDFELAKDKVLMGPERKSMVLSDRDKSITAYHEAGHAIVAKKLPNTDPVHKITIIPRGTALGATQILPDRDRYEISKEFALNQITFMLGGRLAEVVKFDEITSGAANDIEKATDLARKMVCEWGMSEKMGPLTFGKKEEQIFLGKEFGQMKNYSEKTAEEIDQEITRLVMGCYANAEKIIRENMPLLEKLAEALIKYETLERSDIEQIFEGKEIDQVKKAASANNKIRNFFVHEVTHEEQSAIEQEARAFPAKA